MKRASWIITIAVSSAAVLGAGIAATVRLNPSSQPPSPQVAVSPSGSVSPSPQVAVSPAMEPSPSPKLDDFSHQRISLVDRTATDPEFAKFRQQLQKAIQTRDARFVSALIPAKGVPIGFGRSQTVEDLKLTDPKAMFWSILEKAMGANCGFAEPDATTSAKGWICPTVSRDFYRQYPPNPNAAPGLGYELSNVIVVGDRVNVRALPNLNSEVVGVLTNEVVKFDQKRFENSQEEQIKAFDPMSDWTPVVLPNRKQGYVYNRYAYRSLENRAIFKNISGKWQITEMPGGD
ncbi:MAG: SH3 domain-containing protein [Candidatus Parcubacteria bacterium]|nr:SH3 domain-containing protein [Leptolyngbyaceae cyanobacterium LF-bin-113]